MGYHQIFFSDKMVRAILDGRKTQTRRVIKPQPPQNCDTPLFDANGYGWFHEGLDDNGNAFDTYPHNDRGLNCPYCKQGDRLWVREAWSIDFCGGYTSKHGVYQHFDIEYRAGGGTFDIMIDRHDDELTRLFDTQRGSWRPSIHMPRWASRITLEITDIRVERVQDISEEDIEAEGIRVGSGPLTSCPKCNMDAFMTSWDSFYAKRGFGWDVNPFAWVIEFKRVEG